MFTLNDYFGYMIKATIDPEFNGNFFMENTHYRGQYIQYYPAFMKALEEHLRNDFETLELIACLTPSWQEPVATLKKNREKIYKASELISQKVEVTQTVKNLIDNDALRMHTALFIARYLESEKDMMLVGKREF